MEMRHAALTQKLALTIFSQFKYFVVKHGLVLGVKREGDGVTRHGRPRANLKEATFVVLRCKVVEHSSIVNEGIQVPASV